MRSPHPLGSLTLPRVPLTDRSFIYSCAAATNVADTIARERHLLAQEAQAHALAAATQQPLLPGIPQEPPTVRRLRAGMAAPLSLPSL